MAGESSSSNPKAQAWFCTTGLPSDVVVEVGDMCFHLHKFPLMLKSKKIHTLVLEQEQEEEEAEDDEEIEEDESIRIAFPDFPGGSDTFELAAKFCYGVKLELTPSNAVPLRCAAEYLQMSDDAHKDNLISVTDHFLTQSVFRNLKDSIKALKSCDGDLTVVAEDLGLIRKCVDSIAAKARSAGASSLFGWPVSDAGNGSERRLWNGIETGNSRSRRRRNGVSNRSSSVAAVVLAESWFDDLAGLSLPVFKRVISAMKEEELASDVIELSLISYAKNSIPGLSRSSRKSSYVCPEAERIELVETVIGNLPLQKSTASTNTRLLFGLLRNVNILKASDEAKEVLERKIGSQLEQATLEDLLMPNYSYAMETLYDVECVERMVGYFLQTLQERSGLGGGGGGEMEEEAGGRSPAATRQLLSVGKLIDGYLSEISSDANLLPDKFCGLAFSLPEQSRAYDDGLYRAVDVYLKAHPDISEAEKEKLGGVIDCQKLTLEACTHAAQNERLPLRAIVQVLFFEQLQLRNAIAGTLLAAEQNPDSPSGQREGGLWRDNQVLRLDMDSMRNRVHELERECSTMKKAIQRIDRSAAASPAAGGGAAGWSSMPKKFGCKFRSQVCDSQERNIVETIEARKCRTEKSS